MMNRDFIDVLLILEHNLWTQYDNFNGWYTEPLRSALEQQALHVRSVIDRYAPQYGGKGPSLEPPLTQ